MRNPNRPDWCEPPAGDGFPGYDILSPKCAEVLHLVIQSRKLQGVMTHWIGERSAPCVGEHNGCLPCLKATPKRWRGYLWVVPECTSKLCILELTEMAVWPHQARLMGRAAPIAGARAKVRRHDGQPRGKVLLTMGDADERACLREEMLPDLRDTLMRIWYGPRHRWPGQHDQGEDDGPECIPLPGA